MTSKVCAEDESRSVCPQQIEVRKTWWGQTNCRERCRQTDRVGVSKCVRGASRPALCRAFRAFVHLRPLTCSHLIALLSLTRISCASSASRSLAFVVPRVIIQSALPTHSSSQYLILNTLCLSLLSFSPSHFVHFPARIMYSVGWVLTLSRQILSSVWTSGW